MEKFTLLAKILHFCRWKWQEGQISLRLMSWKENLIIPSTLVVSMIAWINSKNYFFYNFILYLDLNFLTFCYEFFWYQHICAKQLGRRPAILIVYIIYFYNINFYNIFTLYLIFDFNSHKQCKLKQFCHRNLNRFNLLSI